MELKGIVIIDKKTKNLVKRIKPGQIAIICHADLDEIAAQSLIEAKVKAVLNATSSITGMYPNKGPGILLKAGIPLIDNLGFKIMNLPEGQVVSIRENQVWSEGKLIAQGSLMTDKRLEKLINETKKNLDYQLNKFITNTLNFVSKEKDIILGNIDYPNIKTNMQNKNVVIVVRGQGYKEDLNAIRPFINEEKPILIGVDGGADALLEIGYKPDLIIGDMDSISDKALRCGAELIVHAYQDGQAPGTRRLKDMQLKYILFSAPGTSEDIAMLLAHEKGADLQVAVGTHSNMIDFLEKGRKGMASTFLVRLKVGPKLVDAKGVSKLYQPKTNLKYPSQIFCRSYSYSNYFSMSPLLNQFIKILILKIRLIIRYKGGCKVFDFRYHMASLIAVFLALGLGILFGCSIIGGEFNEIMILEQREWIERLEKII